jgi:hypothetical protein
MKKCIVLHVAVILLLTGSVFSQSVAINTDGSLPDASAMLDIKNGTKGILIPRVNSVVDVSNPTIGLLVYQTLGISGFYHFSGPGTPGWRLVLASNSAFNGDISGTYSTTTISANAVNSTKIEDGSIQRSDIAPGVLGVFNRVVKVSAAGNTSYTGQLDDEIIGVDQLSGVPFTVTLPSGAPSGKIITIKLEKQNTTTFPNISINRPAGGLIDNGTSAVTFANAGGFRHYYSDGANGWYSF